MYESHWGLPHSPFDANSQADGYFPSETHEEALARLLFLVENRRRAGLLLGASGSGKSLLLEVLAQRLAHRHEDAVRLSMTGVGGEEFVSRLAAELHVGAGMGEEPVFVLWRRLSDLLITRRYERRATVFLLDDIDRASPGAVDAVNRLLHLDSSLDARLTLVLTADPSRWERIDPSLLNLVDLRMELDPWEPSDVGAYLQHALRRAEASGEVFDELAVAKLCRLADGSPRRVRRLAELALIAGAGAQLPRIDQSVVESVFDELSVAPR